MGSEGDPSAVAGDPPKKKGLDISLFLGPTTDVQTSAGRIFLYPPRVSDFKSFEKLSSVESAARFREFLPRVASLSATTKMEKERDLQRSFWLYTHHLALFERASDFDFWAHHGSQAQQYDLGVKRTPIDTEVAMTALRQAISAFYQRERQCGDGCVAYLVERSPGVYLLTVHVKDLAMLRLEFEGVVLKHRVGNPNIHMVLEYAQSTGVVRTLVRGGQKVQQMLVEAFAEHLLGVKTNAQKIKAPCLDLSTLRTGFDVPEVFEDGFSLVQLKSLTLLSPDGDLKIECTAMQASQQRSVHELLKEKLPGPLEGQWAVTAAQVNLYYPPEPGRTRARVVPIEITSRGRLNLHKFDNKLQAQLERYLVKVGILQKGQTLSAQELPPEADAISSSSAFED